VSMSPKEFVAITEGNTERAKIDILRALSIIEDQNGVLDCKAYPTFSRSARMNGYGVIAALENQVTFAKYVTNGGGGVQPQGWKIGLGPFKASGRSIFEFVILLLVMAVVVIHFRTVRQGQKRIINEMGVVVEEVQEVIQP